MREAIGTMSLGGFNVLVRLALSLLWFNSPCNCHPAVVLGVGNGCSNTEALAGPCVDAVPLFMRIKVKGCQACGCEIVLIEIGGNDSIDNGACTAPSISFRARSSRSNILEANMLIKCLGQVCFGLSVVREGPAIVASVGEGHKGTPGDKDGMAE